MKKILITLIISIFAVISYGQTLVTSDTLRLQADVPWTITVVNPCDSLVVQKIERLEMEVASLKLLIEELIDYQTRDLLFLFEGTIREDTASSLIIDNSAIYLTPK